MQLWLYLHFPHLQLDALFSEQSEAPLVIVDEKKHQIVQLNDAALNQSLNIGMGLGSAATLCSHLQVHAYDAQTEQQTLTHIAQWLYLKTSDITLFPPKGILLKVSNMLSLYHDLDTYWQITCQHLEQLNYRYQFATGFSPFSAMLLAKSAKNRLYEDKESIMAQINNLPLSISDLDRKQVEQLRRIGIGTFQELLSLPMQELARRFNIDLVNYVGRLLGQFKHPVTFYHPPETFESHLELLFDIDNVQWLERPLMRLLKQLERFLTLRSQVAYELCLILYLRDHKEQKISFTSASGDYLSDRWAVLCHLSLESLALNAPTHSMRLIIGRYGDRQSATQDIFCGFKGQQTELELISLLQAKLGNDTLYKVHKTHDPRPEKSTAFYHPSNPPIPTKSMPTKSMPIRSQSASSRFRPTFMYSSPQPLTEKANIISGPERIVTGWWDGNDIIRDYFIARSAEGRWLWLFRDQQKNWFVHGQFS
ncbi:Y-family DNA polymerase [Vibrio genomosp. F10]|uniref:Y-family DNA polymerase n=1 Tax=Vibrio genomosp. F10 TaxID=723171 RepID=UPI00030DFDE4|nr:DNA polymerase Y family protein [Vibrio genomosp. F10]OEF04023.1 nucleotidyltransferase [Vibrio genomosp. F10 str. 9ZB36]